MKYKVFKKYLVANRIGMYLDESCNESTYYYESDPDIKLYVYKIIEDDIKCEWHFIFKYDNKYWIIKSDTNPEDYNKYGTIRLKKPEGYEDVIDENHVVLTRIFLSKSLTIVETHYDFTYEPNVNRINDENVATMYTVTETEIDHDVGMGMQSW